MPIARHAGRARGAPVILSDMSAAARATLAVCVITLDEEDRIGDCLDSVAWADELLVVDSGSTDRTAGIAREKGARVVVRDWPGYAAQKNFGLDQLTTDWVLSIDADERVTPELAEQIRGLLRDAGAETAGASVPRCTWYLGRWIRHGGWYPDRKVRLVRRGRGRWQGDHVHERLVVEGEVRRLAGDLQHYSYRGIADHLHTIDRFTSEGARGLAARGRGRGAAVAGMLFNPPLKFLKMYLLRAGFLDGLPGFIVAVLGSYYLFLRYAKLWELKGPFQRTGTAGRSKGSGCKACEEPRNEAGWCPPQ